MSYFNTMPPAVPTSPTSEDVSKAYSFYVTQSRANITELNWVSFEQTEEEALAIYDAWHRWSSAVIQSVIPGAPTSLTELCEDDVRVVVGAILPDKPEPPFYPQNPIHGIVRGPHACVHCGVRAWRWRQVEGAAETRLCCLGCDTPLGAVGEWFRCRECAAVNQDYKAESICVYCSFDAESPGGAQSGRI